VLSSRGNNRICLASLTLPWVPAQFGGEEHGNRGAVNGSAFEILGFVVDGQGVDGFGGWPGRNGVEVWQK